jgi:hypothetical protein
VSKFRLQKEAIAPSTVIQGLCVRARRLRAKAPFACHLFVEPLAMTATNFNCLVCGAVGPTHSCIGYTIAPLICPHSLARVDRNTLECKSSLGSSQHCAVTMSASQNELFLLAWPSRILSGGHPSNPAGRFPHYFVEPTAREVASLLHDELSAE